MSTPVERVILVLRDDIVNLLTGLTDQLDEKYSLLENIYKNLRECFSHIQSNDYDSYDDHNNLIENDISLVDVLDYEITKKSEMIKNRLGVKSLREFCTTNSREKECQRFNKLNKEIKTTLEKLTTQNDRNLKEIENNKSETGKQIKELKLMRELKSRMEIKK